jgi:hypothetical protein
MRRAIPLLAAPIFLASLLPPPAAASYAWEQTGGPEGAVVLCMTATSLGTLLAGTDSGGLYRSNDGGVTWSRSETGLTWPCCNYNIPALAAGEAAIYAGTWGGGVYRSDDDGGSWYPVGAIPNEGYPIILGLAVCRYGETVYASGQFGVVRSDDGGSSWTVVNDGLPSEWIRTLALRGTVLHARADQSGVYRLDEASGTWSAWNDGLPTTSGMQSIGSTADALFLSTHEGGVWRLDCGDSAWIAMNEGLYDDNVDAVVEVDRALYAGLMGGGAREWNPAAWQWEERNDGLWNKDIRTMSRSGISPLSGTWGGGVFRFDPDSDTWSSGSGMESPYVTALLVDEDDVYAATEGAGVFRSGDQGDTWTRGLDGLNDVWVWALAEDGSALYAGTWAGVFRSPDQGETWTQTALNWDGIFALGYWQSALYAGESDGHVWASTDGGDTWNEVGTGLPYATVQGLALLDGVLYAALWGEGVYELADGETEWTAVNGGLDDLAMRSLTVHAGELFLGTDSRGVYRWNDAAAEWDSCGPVDGSVWALATVGGDLLAGTWGGLFASADTGRTWSDVHPGLQEWNAVRALAAGGEHLFAGLMGAGVWRAPLTISAVEEGTGAESGLSLRALKVDPNPFASGARISFRLDHPEPVDLAVYDPSGRLITRLLSGVLPAGPHEKTWDGTTGSGEKAAAGVYLLRLEAGGKKLTTKTVHVR